MVLAKGAGLEELARAYFAWQGYVALRSVSIQFEEEEVTDVDVWLYGRQGGGVRTRALVDVKDKKSPKAFERVMWARGMQLALGCDRAVVTTTDTNPKVTRFAQQQKVTLLTATYLRRWASTEDILRDRMSIEDLVANIQSYSGHKQDGDWIKQISVAKSAVVSLAPYPAFNKAISSFRFFAERAATRPQHREQAVRGAFFSAGLACMALDAALERLSFEDQKTRYRLLYAGVTYGDAGDSRVKGSIDIVLSVISNGIKNGQVLARQTSDALKDMFAGVRAEIIAEFFSKEQNGSLLFPVARELEARAHMRSRTQLVALSTESKAIVGVFADFVGVKRVALLSTDFVAASLDLSPYPRASVSELTKTLTDPATGANSISDMGADISPAKESGSDETEQSLPDKNQKLL